LGISRVDFDFKIFASSNVLVIRTSEAGVDKTLKEGEDYTVTWDEDQTANIGGYITLDEFLADGESVTILSNVAYTQELDLHAEGDFNPNDINVNFDRTEAQIQQLKEKLSRAAVAPASSGMDGDEYGEILLENSKKSGEYAQQAAIFYQQVVQLKDELNALVPTLKAALESEADDQIEEIAQFAQGQIAAILDSTNALLSEQLDRINSAANSALTLNRLLCSEAVKTFNVDTASGSTITLPSGIQYVVSMNHLRLSLNGTILYPEQQYEEVGTASHLSTQVKLLFPAKANDRLEVWVIPIGGTIDEETGEVTPEAGVACNAETWTLTAAITAGTAITLPNSMKYVAGKKHLRLSWNGIILIPVIDWNETGVTGAESTQIKVNFNLAVGDVLNAWTVPYDHGEASTTEARLSALEDSLADLSARVVYKESNNGS
jgi:hypothetical protein